MKILITGGTGFIGFHLAKLCSDRGYTTHICDNNSRGQKDSYIEKLIERNNVEFIRADLTKEKEVSCLEKDYNIVFHLIIYILFK